MNSSIWASQIARFAQLNDLRRSQRFAQILDTKLKAPLQSFTQASGDWGGTKATYRFFSNTSFSHRHLHDAAFEHTASRCQQLNHLILIHDTTIFNFTTSESIPELGNIGHKGHARGLLLHSSLALSRQGQVLGLMGWNAWTRTDDPDLKPEELESQKWCNNFDQIRKAFSQQPRTYPIKLLHLLDREGDNYPTLMDIASHDESAVIRSCQNRALVISEELAQQKNCPRDKNNQPQYSLDDAVRDARLVKRFFIFVPAKKGKTRLAYVEVRATRVTLKPDLESHRMAKPLEWNVVDVRELNQPVDAEQLHWRLLTTEPIETIYEVVQVIELYKKRWRIEDYHLILKSGCCSKKLRLREIDRLFKALVVNSMVAARIQELQQASRNSPEEKARNYLSEEECQVLCRRFGGKLNSESLTINEAVRRIARLGGFLNRKSDKEPGVRTLWKGLDALGILVEGYRLGRTDTN
jgi:hypothetical protein